MKKRTQTQQSVAAGETTSLDRAGEALLAGMTHEQVIAQLVSRIRRDAGYLAYRKACNRHTHDDEQVLVDLRALPLAISWLQEAREPPPLLGRWSGQPYAVAAATSSIAWEDENPSLPRFRSSSARASSR